MGTMSRGAFRLQIDRLKDMSLFWGGDSDTVFFETPTTPVQRIITLIGSKTKKYGISPCASPDEKQQTVEVGLSQPERGTPWYFEKNKV